MLAAVSALVAPAGAAAEVQQVLLPGPAPYPTQSPPLITVGASPFASLPFRIHARSQQRVLAGVDAEGHVVGLHVVQRLLLTGLGDYLIVVSAPAVDVRAAPGSQSQPGLRRGQILWSGFSSRRKVLAADATLRPGAAAPFLPLRLEARREGDRYTLTMRNATLVAQTAYTGRAFPAELGRLLDRTRRESLRGGRLSTAYVSLGGLVRARRPRAQIAAPLRVVGRVRFPSAPRSASGGKLQGRVVSFSAVLGDERPLEHTLDVRGGGGVPQLRVEASTTALRQALRPPAGAKSWVHTVSRRALPASALLRRLIDARMQIVRGDQYQAFLSNPDPAGRNHSVYVYETAAAAQKPAGPAAPDESGRSGALVALLALGAGVVGAGAALVAWAHS